MTDRQTILAFIDRINAHDVEGLAELMSDDHTFIDAHGNEVVGREKMSAGWRGYFEWFPDYYIEVNDVFEEMFPTEARPSHCAGSPAAHSKESRASAGDCPLPGRRL